MSGEDELTITAEELGLEPEELEVHLDEPKAPKEIPPEEGLEELKAKLLAEQNARKRLEEEAAQAASVVTYAVSEKEQSDIALVQSALQQVEREKGDLKARLMAARKAGDIDAETDVITAIQELAINKGQLEQGLDALKARAEQLRQQRAQPVVPQQRVVDPVEAVARGLTPASAKWVREHPEYATDQTKTNKMVAAHYEALSEGIKADTPDYFQFVEQKLGIVAEPEARQTTTRAAPRLQPPAAPARISAPPAGKRTVTLSAAEREVAKMNGMTDEEYAKNKMALMAEGKIGKAN